MRVKTPEISWHNTTPVYSCDIQPNTSDLDDDPWVRLATCGRDNVIRIWRLPISSCQPEFLASLRRHDKPVNVVRFIPTGEDTLASGGDDGLVILWKRDTTSSSSAVSSSRALFGQDAEEEEENRELWQVSRILRRHLEDVYDLSWSSDGQCLISGSVDHSAIEWNLKSGQQLLLKDHKQYVQGVAWDPRDEYVLSMGSDRSCRVYRVGSRNCSYNVMRHEKQRLFQDDSWKSFFRRLSFSPDGALVICPAGCHGMDGNAAYVFTRQSLPTPVLALPTETRPVVAVRFCPTPFCLPEGCTPLFALPYMWIFCLVVEDGLLFYNTVNKYPIAYVAAIHYQALNDACWSQDGRLVVTCSTDGYCSVIEFDPYELGRPQTEKVNLFRCHVNAKMNSSISEKVAPKLTEETPISKGSPKVSQQTPKISVGQAKKENVVADVKVRSETTSGESLEDTVRSTSSLTSATSKPATDEKEVTKTEEDCSDQVNETKEVKNQIEPEPSQTQDVRKEKDSGSPANQENVSSTALPISDLHGAPTEEIKDSIIQPSPQTEGVCQKSDDGDIVSTPAKKKRRVTFATLPASDSEAGGPVEISVGISAESKEERQAEKKADETEVPRKRRVAITTISSEPVGDDSSSPLHTMKRRVPFTTLTSHVSPDDVNDNLSNMSAPEFSLTLEDSVNECKKADSVPAESNENP